MPAVQEEQIQTFAAFEGKVSGNTIKGVSLLQEGPALGHGVWVDRVMLEQGKKLAAAKGKIKAKQNHWSGIEDTLGYYENFRIRAGKLVADLTLFDAAPTTPLMLEMIESIPEAFGVSIKFAPDAEEYDKTNDRYNARIRELYSADFVDTPAANRGGVFEAAIDKEAESMPAELAAPSPEAFDAKTAIEALEAKLDKLTPSEPEPKDELNNSIIGVLSEDVSKRLAALQAKLDDTIKLFTAAPPTKPSEAAPTNEPEGAPPPPISYAAARKEAIGTNIGLERIKAARAFDTKYADEAAYIASFKN